MAVILNLFYYISVNNHQLCAKKITEHRAVSKFIFSCFVSSVIMKAHLKDLFGMLFASTGARIILKPNSVFKSFATTGACIIVKPNLKFMVELP